MTETWYIHRCGRCPDCSQCAGSKWKQARVVLLWLAGLRLIHGQSVESSFPHILGTTITLRETNSEQDWPEVGNHSSAGRQFRVTATVGGGAGSEDDETAGLGSQSRVSLWWNTSPNRVYNSNSQPEWSTVNMTLAADLTAGQSGRSYTFVSGWVDVPDAQECAWYVDVTSSVERQHQKSKRVPVSDSSAIKFAYRTPATKKQCHIPQSHFCGK